MFSIRGEWPVLALDGIDLRLVQRSPLRAYSIHLGSPRCSLNGPETALAGPNGTRSRLHSVAQSPESVFDPLQTLTASIAYCLHHTHQYSDSYSEGSEACLITSSGTALFASDASEKRSFDGRRSDNEM